MDRLRAGHVRRRAITALLLAAVVLLTTGCLHNPPTDVVRLQADEEDQLVITIDAEGWFTALAGENGARVTEQIIVETAQPTLRIVWRNEDVRFHEIMFHRDHSDDDAIELNPGDSAEQQVDPGFEGYVHSHHAPEMPELRLRVESATR